MLINISYKIHFVYFLISEDIAEVHPNDVLQNII